MLTLCEIVAVQTMKEQLRMTPEQRLRHQERVALATRLADGSIERGERLARTLLIDVALEGAKAVRRRGGKK